MSALLFGHRGAAAECPENTLPSFRRALAIGVDVIETDVHMTRDGHIVCFHDHDLRRTTNGRGKIWELSLAELRRLDAGYQFTADGHSYPFRGQGITVPTLEEVLALDPSARVNLEIKQAQPTMAEALWRRIDALGVHARVLVAGEDARLVWAFRQFSRGAVATSAGRAEILAFWLAVRAGLSARVPVSYDALQIPIRYRGLEVTTPALVRAAHRRGIQVHVWTIDAPEEMRFLVDIGVDGIMTDQPKRLASFIEAEGLMPDLRTPAPRAGADQKQ